MNKEEMIKKLVEQGMHRIEAEAEIIAYNRKARELFIESLDCERV